MPLVVARRSLYPTVGLRSRQIDRRSASPTPYSTHESPVGGGGGVPLKDPRLSISPEGRWSNRRGANPPSPEEPSHMNQPIHQPSNLPPRVRAGFRLLEIVQSIEWGPCGPDGYKDGRGLTRGEQAAKDSTLWMLRNYCVGEDQIDEGTQMPIEQPRMPQETLYRLIPVADHPGMSAFVPVDPSEFGGNP